MANLNNFDANTVDPSAPFEPIPAGDYLACIVASQMKPTKNGTGQYLELEIEVLEGEYKGRKVWDRLNLQNPNCQTVEIARADLSAICHAVGVMTPKDSVELHNIPMVVMVGLEKRKDSDQLTNVIKGYVSKAAAAKTPAAAAPTAGNNGKAPWLR